MILMLSIPTYLGNIDYWIIFYYSAYSHWVTVIVLYFIVRCVSYYYIPDYLTVLIVFSEYAIQIKSGNYNSPG